MYEYTTGTKIRTKTEKQRVYGKSNVSNFPRYPWIEVGGWAVRHSACVSTPQPQCWPFFSPQFSLFSPSLFDWRPCRLSTVFWPLPTRCPPTADTWSRMSGFCCRLCICVPSFASRRPQGGVYTRLKGARTPIKEVAPIASQLPHTPPNDK